MSDIIKIGTQDATFKVGSSAVTAIFLGSNQVYPSGSQETYTQVEYIENSSNAYINLEVDPYDTLGNSFTIEATFSSYTQSNFGYLASTESVTSPYYGFVFRWNSSVLEFDGASLRADTTATNVPNQDGTSAITISSTSTTTSNNNTPITLFCGLNGSSPWRNGMGRLYSFRMVLNNVTVRDMIPVVRDSDSKAGMYDRVNDVFYASPNGVLFTAGSPVPSNFKYKLTLSDSSVVSAACDGTSAITSGEISAYSESCVSAEINNCITNIDASAFLSFTNIRNISLPDSLTTIGDYAFYHCVKLTGLTIPSGVTTIGQQFLAFTERISSVTVYPTTPPAIGQNAFGSQNFPIYVPCESINAYKSAPGWSNYASRITCIPTPSYEWVSYASGDTVPTATTVYGVKLYMNYDENYNVIFSNGTGDYIKFHPNGDFGQWSAEDENGNSISISSYFSPSNPMYTIVFSDLGLGGMNVISPTTTFEDDIDLYT